MLYINHPRRVERVLALTLLLLSFVFTCVSAQDIRLNVIVPNPPPVTWDAYLEFDADILIIISNVSSTVHELKLVPTLTSDRGLNASFKPDYQPLAPLTIGPGETRNLTYRDLRALFGTPTEDDIALEGINFDRLFASETIPEGNYTLCVEARDFVTNEALSNNFGCGIFYVQQHEPPLIIWPFDGEAVTALTPQFLNFLWSTTGIPGRTRYRFALYDLDELGLFNGADAFLLAATRPLYEADDLVANNLPYDLALPPLIPGHRYAVQVIAYDPDGELLFAQGGQSAVHQFSYQQLQIVGEIVNPDPGLDGPGTFVTQTPGNQLSLEDCPDLPLPQANAFVGTLTSGQTLTVGEHDLVLNSGGTPPLAGTGRLLVESLNTYVNVSFTGLLVNQNLEVYGESAVVTATAEGNPNLDNLSEAAALQLADLVDNNGNWLNPNNNDPGPGINLPAGIAGAGMDLIMTGMTFTPAGATLDLFAKVELPEAQGSRRLVLVGEGACLNADDLGANMDLLLANDAAFALAPGVDMTFAGGDAGTRLQWNEQGIENLAVDFTLSFAGNAMPGNSPLSARVTATVEDYQDWIGTVEFLGDQNAPPPSEEVSFYYNKIAWTYDHSSTQNPGGLTLPPSHPDAGTPNLWQGLYLPEFDVIFPEGFDVTIAAEELILDQSGVWTRVDIDGNLLDISDGEIGGWALGIDGLDLDIRGSSFHAASFDGRLRLPLGPDEVAFTAPLGGGQDFSVALDIGQDLDVDMWIAQIELAGNSTVGFTKVGNSYRPETNLHGNISLGWDSVEDAGEDDVGVSQFSLPGLEFENFRIVGGPSPSVSGTFGLDMEDLPQGGMQNFPLQLNDVDLTIAGQDIRLDLDIGLSLSNQQNGFHGTTNFSLIGQLENGQYRYDRTQLNQLTIDAELNLISIQGSIDIFDQHETYGTGFDGQVSVDIEQIGAGLDMRLMVGRAPQDYRYFMVDALVKLPDNAGIPIGTTPLAFFGFGGGFWRNMNRQAAMPEALNYGEIETIDQSDNDPGEGATTVYLPASGTTGFSFKTIIGLNGAKKAVNGDLELYMEINDDFSLDEILLAGNVYVVQDIADRGPAFIHGQAELRLAPVEGLFTLSSNLQVDFPGGLLTQNHPLWAGFRTKNDPGWWFYLGQWTPGANPLDDDSRLTTETNLNFGLGQIQSVRNGYFMMGTEMPDGLPGVPAIVTSQFASDGKELPGQQFNGNGQSYNTTNGFAFGVGRRMDLEFDVRIFRLGVGYTWGFDLLLADMSQSDCSADDFGLNQWYAQGQAYAHCHIDGSVKGRLFGKTREFKFVELDAAALMQFQGPNPIWIKGNARIRGRALGKLIKFDTNASFEFGEKVECRDDGSNIFDEIPIVEEITPKQGTKGRSIFTAPEASFNFPNEPLAIEEGSGDDTEVRYYGYKIVSLKVESRGEDDNNFSTFLETTEPNHNYDEEGYAAIFNLEELPPNADIKVTLRVQGVRYDGPLGLSEEETFSTQKFETTFSTGPPPDHILKGSIVNTVPFRRQLYFTKGDHPTGRIDWYRPQWSDLFRDKPNADDKLDPAGNYSYVARIIRLDNGEHRDRPLTNINTNSGVSFSLPTGWLAPNMGYRVNILRLYTPPQGGGPATDTTLVDLEMYSGPVNPYVFNGDELGEAPPGNNNGGGIGGFQQVGMTQLQFQNQGQQQGNGLGQTLAFSNGGDDPGPDPPFTPQFDLNSNEPGDGPGFDGPQIFQNPGGNLGGLSRYSRELKKEGRVSAQVAKNLWPEGQSAWYFRTSEYNTLNAKIQQLDPVNNGETYTRTVKVNADDLYVTAVESVELPYVLLETDEPFDRYETKYWKRTYQAKDQGQNIGNPHTRKFYPAVDIEGDEGQWSDLTFYGDRSGGSRDGLFRAPFGDVDDWCEEVFDHPDNNGIENTTPCYGQGGRNAPLHEFQIHTWDVYMTVVPGPKSWDGNPPGMNNIGYQQWISQTRYGSDTPFGRNAYGRRLPSPTNFAMETDLATVELVQWNSNGGMVDGLGGSGAKSSHTWFTDGMIDALGGNGQVNPGFLPDNLNIQLNGQDNIMPANQVHYLSLIDFTEWVTLKDYFGFREVMSRGIDEILDIAENDLNLNPGMPVNNADCDALVMPDCNPDGDGDPSPPGPLPNLDGIRPFAIFYHPQLRRWLKHKGPNHFGLSNSDYHRYPGRPAGTHSVKIGNQTFEYSGPQLNAN